MSESVSSAAVIMSEALTSRPLTTDMDVDYPKLWIMDGFLNMATSYDMRWIRSGGSWRRMYRKFTIEEMRQLECEEQ